MIIAFLVRLMLELLLFLAEEGWGVENAFRSLEEFGVRTCDVRKELVLILLCYFLLNVWFVLWVGLWEFCQSLVDFLP
ncbi:putative transposase [Sulfurisphaera tokodaii str. 7]|uniref:Transposase n=1 Tax=Sulfurisphaera tokodaii (strain DSM 16993 / JCM 10545 / NBRC 100140 / 7) TaxID=273063 RepID=F9VPI9_SULTO|nr:putative transposase [Sulfurisphaera tokodaii str. 7]